MTKHKTDMNQAKRWWERVKSFFTSAGNTATLESEYDNELKEFGLNDLGDNLNLSRQELLLKISEDGKRLKKMGEADGRDGLNTSLMKETADYIAKFWQSYVHADIQKNIKAMIIEKEDARNHQEHLKDQQAGLSEHKKLVDKHYMFYSKHYNIALGIFYLIIAFGLVLADFPLAVQSAREGFDLKGDLADFGLPSFPDANLFAFGIVFMTIYIKIMYDKFFGVSVGKMLLRERSENILNSEEVARDTEMKKAKRVSLIRAIALWVIFGIMIMTLISLGIFRYKYVSFSSQIPTEDLNKEAIKLIQAKESLKGWSAYFSFVSVSILFPLVGGVCGSLGLNHIRNRLERWRLQQRLKMVRKKIDKSIIALKKCENRLNELESNLEWAQNDGSFQSNCANYLFTSYLNGYDRGIHQVIPEDLYDAAHWARGKMIASNISNMYTNRAQENKAFSFIRTFLQMNIKPKTEEE